MLVTVLQFVALFIGTYFSALSEPLIFFLCTALVSLAGKYRLQALGAINLAFFLFCDLSFYSRSTGQNPMSLLEGNFSEGAQLLIRITALVVLFGLTMALWMVHRRTRFRYLFSINFLCLMAVLLSQHLQTQDDSFLYLTSWMVLALFAKHFWALTFSQLAFTNSRVVFQWLCALPFWGSVSGSHIGGMPRGVGELQACLVKDRDSLVRARTSGLKFLGLGFAMYFVYTRVFSATPGFATLPGNFLTLGIHELNLANVLGF